VIGEGAQNMGRHIDDMLFAVQGRALLPYAHAGG
jgi:hypothetical protein